jgi:hypothetical protein
LTDTPGDSNTKMSPRRVSEQLNQSMNAQGQQQLYGFTHDIIEEATSGVDTFEANEKLISNLKPVLKKNCLHMGNNVICTWKSFEVWLIQ